MNRTRTPRPNLLHQVERDRRQVLRNVRCARWFVKDARTPPPPYRAAALETVQSSNSADHETRHAQSAVPHATPAAVVARHLPTRICQIASHDRATTASQLRATTPSQPRRNHVTITSQPRHNPATPTPQPRHNRATTPSQPRHNPATPASRPRHNHVTSTHQPP